jgi:hypothetical protein
VSAPVTLEQAAQARDVGRRRAGWELQRASTLRSMSSAAALLSSASFALTISVRAWHRRSHPLDTSSSLAGPRCSWSATAMQHSPSTAATGASARREGRSAISGGLQRPPVLAPLLTVAPRPFDFVAVRPECFPATTPKGSRSL